MANVFELNITARNVRDYWEENAKDRPPYLGEAFFPATKQIGLELNLIKGKQGVPVALVSAGWDTDVLYRDRIGLETLNAELPFFKEAYKVSEKLRQQILTANEKFQTALFKRVFDDTNDLLEGAEVSVERMRMQLLGNGTISIVENGVNKQYDYGFNPSTQAVTESTLWSASGAKPFKSFASRVKAYKQQFKKDAKYAVFGYNAYQALLQDEDVLGYFAKLLAPNLAPTDEEIISYIEGRTGVRIFVNDKQYIQARDDTKTPVYYYPANKYTLFPSADLGETVYGSTPEEVDLASGSDSSALSCEVLEKGVAITTWKEADPVCVSVKASEVALPSCPLIDKLYIVTVLS